MAEKENTGVGANGATPLTPEQEIAQLKAQIAAKDTALESSKKIIGEQAEALATKEIQVGSKHPVVMVDKTHYAFLGKGNIIIDGKSFTAKEVMESKEMVAGLIKIGSGLVKKITVKKAAK